MKLIYEGFETQQLSESIEESLCKKLIQELNFKYGLKVIHKEDKDPRKYNPVDKFLLVDTNGFAVAKVWTDKEDGYDIFNYRSPFYRKDRGSDSADRETLHSKKLSTLVATLKRNHVVPPPDGMINKFQICDSLNQAISHMDSHHGRDYKNSPFSVDDIHAMLKVILLGESTNQLNINNCKEVLDKWNEQDRICIKKQEDIERFFNTEFYAIGADILNHLVVGSVKRVQKSATSHYSFEIVKPFKRMVDVPDELKAVLTMNKVYMEGKESSTFYANIIPQANGYNPDLDLINTVARKVDEFNLAWTLVPCSGI